MSTFYTKFDVCWPIWRQSMIKSGGTFLLFLLNLLHLSGYWIDCSCFDGSDNLISVSLYTEPS